MSNKKHDKGRHWRLKTLKAGFRESLPHIDNMTKGQLKKAYTRFIKGYNSHSNHRNRIKVSETRKPYLKRGRRVFQGRCSVCGEYYPKQERVVYKKVTDSRGNSRIGPVRQVYVQCQYHGETLIEENGQSQRT